MNPTATVGLIYFVGTRSRIGTVKVMSAYFKTVTDLWDYRFLRLVLFASALALVLAMTNVHWANADDRGTDGDDCHTHTSSNFVYHLYMTKGRQVTLQLPADHGVTYEACSEASYSAVSWSISPSITGLSLATATGKLTGSISVAGNYETTSTHTYQHKKKTSDAYVDATTDTTVHVHVSETGLGVTLVNSPREITVNEYAEVTAPFATVGAGWGGARTYLLYGPSIAGMSYDGSSGSSQDGSNGSNQSDLKIKGTPSALYEYEITFTVRERVLWRSGYSGSSGNNFQYYQSYSSSKTFELHVVAENAVPSFAGSISDKVYTRGSSITPSILRTASGGDGDLTYSLTPSVAGLSFNSSTRTLSGTPTSAGGTAMTYKATDADGDEAELNFSITVNVLPTPTPAPTSTPSPTSTPTLTAASFGSRSVASQGYIKDEAITNLVLPSAASGTGSKIYRLTPSVPGLTFTASNRTLSGTPTALGAHNMAYTVSNSVGSDTLNFSITVSAADTAPTFGSSTVSDRVFGKDVGINTLQLPAGSGGNGALTYSLSALPSGLSFDAATRLVTGAPDTLGETAMTYTVSDADSNTETTDSDSLTFSIEVEIADIALTGFASSVATQVYEEGVQISALQLPRADGGNVPITYELTPAVPGLSFDAFTRRLTGTPTTAATHDMSYTATDSKDVPESVTAAFTITIKPPDIDPILDTAISDQLYDTLTDVTPWVLPEGSAGNGALVYALTPAIHGLNFDAATRQLSGRASMVGIYAMTYTVTDYDGDVARLNFSIVVEPGDTTPEHFDTAVAIQSYQVGSEVGIINLPSVVGGDPPFTYSLKPDVPGLIFHPATRQITGIPTAAGNHVMTYQVMDVDGDTHTMLFIIRVDGVPSFDGALSDLVYEDGVGIGTLALPEAFGGNLPVTYELTPQVPGLSFDAESREITGTPTAVGSYGMKYEVVDHNGDSDVGLFTITVNESDTPPVFGSNVPTRLTFKLGKEMAPIQLGLAEGGNGELRYSWAPAVPGLRLEPTTGELTGTPTQEGIVETVLTVTDQDGDSGTVLVALR